VTAALVLAGYAVLLSVLAPRLLAGAAWVERAPLLGIAMWQAVTAAVFVAPVLGALALSVPTLHATTHLALLLRACEAALRTRYATPGGAATGAAGILFALTVAVRLAYVLLRTSVRTLIQRRRQIRILELLGTADPTTGVIVLDDPSPAAYCLPGRTRRIVVTRAALDSLAPRQLEAVLAHERAHLSGRHDLALILADSLSAAFGHVTVFRVAAEQIARLVEIRADDVALAETDPLTVAEALLTLGRGCAPSAALGASGPEAAARIRRLIAMPTPLHRAHRLAAAGTVALVLALPILAFAAPAVLALADRDCPPGLVAAVSLPQPSE
jgi:Zn-dependent protease with chaperone function